MANKSDAWQTNQNVALNKQLTLASREPSAEHARIPSMVFCTRELYNNPKQQKRVDMFMVNIAETIQNVNT